MRRLLWKMWPHRVMGHAWRYRGHKVCPGCQRMHRVWECPPCTAIRELR